MCDATKRLLFLSPAYAGHTHDFTIFKEWFAGLQFSGRTVYVDSGFMGIRKTITEAIIHLPHKASRNHPLTLDQKAKNTVLAKIRVVVENSIAKMKSFFVLRIKNRMKIKQRLNEAIGLCAELANLKIVKSLIVSP